ncbi:acetyl esterase/lipase [Rhodococcus sp. PvR044]|jgi:acetyl esterase/lipase|uniref:alpha/beta hydrolase n=1 Tax=Rhodococcus TaxID=1827 RepID=UPI000BC4DFE5|nr:MULTISPECIES: alpha/beta hydrolase [Rhodococcus]MBP1161116.1 triacylglycerol lipase [Rhodococcus sp. PvR099]MCZ4557579.1 alpha/beta hydrolase [Rhodococcus maanshanensis]PTR39510.1 triacylglycerol lipase [Rhodococcus sp. OK611]SNX92661.1 triacylglycerol lipase [Rhodococcus sp. OK270]
MQGSIVWHWNVSLRARLVFWFARIFIKPLFTVWPMSDRGILALGKLDEWSDRTPAPKGVSVEPVTLGGVPCEKVTHPRRATDALQGATILYFHGGGFVFCGLATHRAACGALAARSGVPVISVEYRQLPYGGIGTSLFDAMAAYTALLETCEDPTRIIVAGDSAGGYLAMKVAEICALQGITPPAAVIGYSPLLNVDLESHDPEYMKRDAYLPMRQVRNLKDRWLAGPDLIVGAQSPVAADPTLFPPVFLSAAEYELMRPDVEIMTDRLERAGRPVETHLWSGQIHAFPVLGIMLEESKTLIALSIEFARRNVASRERRSA